MSGELPPPVCPLHGQPMRSGYTGPATPQDERQFPGLSGGTVQHFHCPVTGCHIQPIRILSPNKPETP